MLIFATISKFIVLYKLFKTLKIMKKIFTFAFALVCAIAANAQNVTLTLSGSDKEITPVVLTAGKSAKTYVWGENVSTFCAFQADIYLPAGVTAVGGKESTLTTGLDEFDEPIATHKCETGMKEGFATLLCYNSDLTKFNADKGSLMQLNLKADAGFVGGAAQFKNIIFSDPKTNMADGEEFVIAETTGINDVKAIDVNAPKYNFQGVQVKDAKMFIQGGKKYIK